MVNKYLLLLLLLLLIQRLYPEDDIISFRNSILSYYVLSFVLSFYNFTMHYDTL